MNSELIIKYLDGKASEAEAFQIIEWLEVSEDNKNLFIELKKTWAMTPVTDSSKNEVWVNINKIIKANNSHNFKEFFKYAAILTLCLTIAGIFLYNKSRSSKIPNSIVLEIQDTQTKIELNNNSVNGIKQLDGIILSQTDNEIIYNEIITDRPISYHSLNIPFGKIFKAILADGTVVHLNAGSSLRYPQQFAANKPRTVFLNGEAYFDVKRGKNRPFIVAADDVSIQVLGTAFNVNTSDYSNEFHCVLVEGSVEIAMDNNKAILKPGEKGSKAEKGKTFNISEVNTNTYTSWIRGELLFEDSSFEEIANKLSKYYNMKFENKNEVLQNQRFSGSISLQNSDLESILELLSLDTPFSYEKSGNKITITNYEP